MSRKGHLMTPTLAQMSMTCSTDTDRYAEEEQGNKTRADFLAALLYWHFDIHALTGMQPDRIHACMYAYFHAWIPACMHKCLLACLHALLPACMQELVV